MSPPHVLVIPYPAQGHVLPLLALSHNLLNQGFKVTFAVTQTIHTQLLSTAAASGATDGLRLVSVPDGGEDRKDLGLLCESILSDMPRAIERVIEECGDVVYLLADMAMGWAVGVGERMGIKGSVVWLSSAGLEMTILNINKLVEDGVIHHDGLPKKEEPFQLIPGIPPMGANFLAWNCINDPNIQKIIFNYFVTNNAAIKKAEFILCNSFYELEPAVFAHANPPILPIGPIIPTQRNSMSGSLWTEDSDCMAWLDNQPANSVIYVAFGSFTIFDEMQFHELALGLELTNRPFLWVVGPDQVEKSTHTFPSGFIQRMAHIGKMVGWSPQREVLSHSSVGCFMTHCGWNSTMEGLTNGLPLLCWPYFLDQFLNRDYVCDVWRNGLRLETDGSGVVTKEEIKGKVEELLSDGELRRRALHLKEVAQMNVGVGGVSFHNFERFVQVMKSN